MRKLRLGFDSSKFDKKTITTALIGLAINIAVLAILGFGFISFTRNNLIGVDAAREKALIYAGLPESAADNASVHLRFEKLKLFYFVEFKIAGKSVEYQIEAKTGNLVKTDN